MYIVVGPHFKHIFSRTRQSTLKMNTNSNKWLLVVCACRAFELRKGCAKTKTHTQKGKDNKDLKCISTTTCGRAIYTARSYILYCCIRLFFVAGPILILVHRFLTILSLTNWHYAAPIPALAALSIYTHCCAILSRWTYTIFFFVKGLFFLLRCCVLNY